ncbi:hypothetical protein Dimus_010238, partial [Dionaea muscipula]
TTPIWDSGEKKGDGSMRTPSDEVPFGPALEDPAVVLVEVPVVTQGGGEPGGKESLPRGTIELDGA